METEREYFNRLANELASLRNCEPSEESFLEKYYKKIEHLLELSFFEADRSCKHYYENTYKHFKKIYLRFWNNRLQPYRLGKCSERTMEELRLGKEYLTEFLQVLNKIPSLGQALGPDILAFLRSDKYAVEAIMLMKEKGDAQKILMNWQKAGEVCKPPKRKFLMSGDLELLAQGENCFSQQYKLQAFYRLEKQPKDYNEIVSDLEKSKGHAQRALGFYQQAGNSKLEANTAQHIAYVDYWISVFVSRQCLLDKDFEESKSAIKEAIKHAKIVDPTAKRIFPNRFRDFQDLETEDYFIQACEVLTRVDLESCKASLETWLERSDKSKGTWRYLNIALRREAVECLIYCYISKDSNAYSRAKEMLKERISSRPQVGSHTRSIINIIEREFATKEGVCGELYSVFPLDTYPPPVYEDKLFEPRREEKLRQLPPFYRDWLNISALNNEIAFLTIDYIFFSYLRTVIEHLYHYFCLLTDYGKIKQTLPDDFPMGFDKLGWEDIEKAIETLYGILKDTKKGDFLHRLSEHTKRYQEKTFEIRSRLFELRDLASEWDKFFLRDLATQVLRILEETGGYLFPHPVKVRNIVEKIESGRIAYTLERIWGKDEKEMDLILEIDQPRLEKNRFYFLGNKWKWKDYDYIEYVPRKDENLPKEIKPSISFGVPRRGCVLLYEGATEKIALPILLNSINPYWTILDISLIKGVGDSTLQKYDTFREENRYVVTIADKDVQEKSNWRRITENKNTFLLNPDFEGMNLEYFIESIKSIYPELKIDITELNNIMNNRIKRLGWKNWGGTLKAFNEYLGTCVQQSERPKYKVEKTKLAPLLAKEIVEKGMPEQIEKALNRLMNLAEGRDEYE